MAITAEGMQLGVVVLLLGRDSKRLYDVLPSPVRLAHAIVIWISLVSADRFPRLAKASVLSAEESL